MMKFNVVAYFGRSIAGRRRACTLDQGRESLFAETPESAARKFLWSLGSPEREVTTRLIVWPPKPHPIVATYQGDTLVYERAEGRLRLVETRAGTGR